MKLTKEQQKICDKYSARDEEGFVHCHECPLAINHTYHLCLKVATRHDLKEYGMAVWMSKEEIALEEAEKMLKYGATDKEKVLARFAIEADRTQRLYRRKMLELIELIDDMSKRIRERHIDDDVCGLCEYDGNHFIGPSGDYLEECPGFERDDCFCMSNEFKRRYIDWEE